jgi:hypothetical protein
MKLKRAFALFACLYGTTPGLILATLNPRVLDNNMHLLPWVLIAFAAVGFSGTAAFFHDLGLEQGRWERKQTEHANAVFKRESESTGV